jgi:TolB-like protein/Flp pilus assembly protein TadD
MTSESDPKLEIAHVLTMDVVEYSTLLITEQSKIMADLNRMVRSTARFCRAEAEGKLLRLPTGDGMALVFFNDPEAPIECAMEISAANKGQPDIPLRMGIHSGPVNQVIDVNDRSNIAGAGIDVAQRVMDCGDAGHILLSKRVAEDLAPYPKWNPHLHDLGECEVKHGRKVSLVNFYTDNVGNPAPPEKCRATRQRSNAPTAGMNDFVPSRKRTLFAAAAFLVFALLIGIWIFSRQRPALRASNAPGMGAGAKSIAVLPFENLSHDPENAYFADGIQEEILTRLSKIADLKVISRTSTQRYKSAPENLLEIAKQLDVANILEGSVQKSADQVRVNVQLINALNDSHLWAEKYDRKMTDIFGVESEIATKIADTLQAKLTGAEQHAIAARPTENTEAHQAYLKGQYYWYKYPAPGFEKSRDYFQQAIDLDPTYAPGYLGLSYFYGLAAAVGVMPPNDSWPKAEAATNKAIALDDTLPDAYNAIAAAKLYFHRDWATAERYFRRGIELNPNSAEIRHHYAFCLILFGRNEEALTEMQRAAELDPLALRNNLDRSKMFFFSRQYDRAIDQFRKTLELYPDFAAAHEWLGYAYQQRGMPKEAVAEWGKALTLSGKGDQASFVERAYSKGGLEPAVRVLVQQQLEELGERVKRGEYVSAAEYATAYTRLGDKEQAFAWLAKAVEERDRFALEFRINPLFDPLRSDPRFTDLVKRIGLDPAKAIPYETP